MKTAGGRVARFQLRGRHRRPLQTAGPGYVSTSRTTSAPTRASACRRPPPVREEAFSPPPAWCTTSKWLWESFSSSCPRQTPESSPIKPSPATPPPRAGELPKGRACFPFPEPDAQQLIATRCLSGIWSDRSEREGRLQEEGVLVGNLEEAVQVRSGTTVVGAHAASDR